jgi:transcriptional regulator with XRE-family HTH domain
MAMTFGARIRDLRRGKDLTLRGLAAKVGIGFTYISKIENGKLDFGDYPSESLIRKLAAALDADLDELFVLAQIVPERIKRRVLERPDAFRCLAELDDGELDRIVRKHSRLKT